MKLKFNYIILLRLFLYKNTFLKFFKINSYIFYKLGLSI